MEKLLKKLEDIDSIYLNSNSLELIDNNFDFIEDYFTQRNSILLEIEELLKQFIGSNQKIPKETVNFISTKLKSLHEKVISKNEDISRIISRKSLQLTSQKQNSFYYQDLRETSKFTDIRV